MKDCIRKLAGALIVLSVFMGIISCSSPEPKIVKQNVYVCPKCEKTYDTATKAANCCGVQIQEVEKLVFVCPKCKTTFSTADAAANCCGVQIQEVEKEVEKLIYVCPKCKKTFTTADDAANCCGVQIQEVEKEVEKLIYVCPKCKKTFTTADDAANCCGVQIQEVEKEVEKLVYVCPKCKKTFTTADAAANCCGVQIQEVEKEVEKLVYVCPKCKKTFTTADDAANCCGVQIQEVEIEVEKLVYVCPKCKKTFITADAAANCCGVQIQEVEKLVYGSELSAGTYTVYHFQQKTTGGKAIADYVLESTESNKAVADKSTIEILKKEYIGFTAKAMAKNENAIYIFYDRNTITYTFLSGTEGKFEDGTTSKTVSGLYGASYTKPEAPTSKDYYFIKWQDSEETSTPSTFGAENKTWNAVWKEKGQGGVAIPEGFVKIEAGTFQMGSNQGYGDNKPVHNVTIKKDFLMCDHEVTQAEFEAVMGINPSSFKTSAVSGEVQANRPVECVSWYAAIAYCNKKSIADGLTPCYTVAGITDWTSLTYGSIPTSSNSTWNAVTCDWNANGYRLPTEAEWEYAARAGDDSVDALTWSGTKTESELGNYAWYGSNSGSKTHEVKKANNGNGANAWGLYDMSGNVWEWCWDWYSSSYSSSAQTAPTGVSSGSRRVSRGGCWNNVSDGCAVSYRDLIDPGALDDGLGFRVVRSAN